MIPDRIVAGTLLCAAAVAGGEIALVDGGPGAPFRVVLPRGSSFAEAAQ